MQRAANVAELLDGPLDDPDLLGRNLADLRRNNRLLGGSYLSAHALERLAPGKAELSILDVGTGAADIPLALLDRARRTGRRLDITAVDSRPEVLAAARAIEPRLAAAERDGHLRLVVADGSALPFEAGAFDIGHASMVVHHLEPDEAVAFLRELGRVSGLGIVVNDLLRSRGNWLGALLLTRTLAPSPLTRNDGPLSVRRAYTLAELRDLVRAAGLRPVGERHGLLRHRVAIAAR
jgi:SAM-dependent methyltransferase